MRTRTKTKKKDKLKIEKALGGASAAWNDDESVYQLKIMSTVNVDVRKDTEREDYQANIKVDFLFCDYSIFMICRLLGRLLIQDERRKRVLLEIGICMGCPFCPPH